MTLTKIQQKIAAKFENSETFLPYIEEIRFPMYKSLDDGLTLSLNWPIVALVGPNGTNKSSVLQAISAAPEGRSLAPFWFSTQVDDIDQGIRGRATHRFIYKYKFDNSGAIAECRKYRGSKKYRATDVPAALRGKRDPDYWEPTKRVASDGMTEIPAVGCDDLLSNNRDRWNQIRKPVVFLDFRSELSAFDKYIHHQSFDRWVSDPSQKRYKVILKSKWIARALNGSKLPKDQAPRLTRDVRYLAKSEVDTIAKILAKPIDSIAMVEHRFFGPTGYTVRLSLQNTGASYSEAHAGSGEYAVVRLVDAVRNADAGSLILLDEPEVSLHPGAQAELLRFIEHEVLAHGHQVVMSTHSPSLAAGLPPQAIKVLGFDSETQRVVLVADGCSPTEAFAHLGHTTAGPARPRVIVEDDLAAEIVRASLRRRSATKLDNLEIVAFPGGANGIVLNVLSTVMLSGVGKTSILLDGDQLPSTAIEHTDLLAEANDYFATRDISALKSIWSEQFHQTLPRLHSNSDKGQDAKTLHDCILWARKYLGFLPGRTPEELIAKASDPAATAPGNDWKKFWVDKTREKLHLTAGEPVTSGQILQIQRFELASLPDNCTLFRDVSTTLDRIVEW